MLIEIIGHTTYVLLAISYLVRDIVWLRIIAIPASLCSMIFCYWGVDEPIWLIIGWNCVFLIVNGYQLGAIRYSIHQSHKSPKFAQLWKQVRQDMQLSDAVKLFRCSTQADTSESPRLLDQGIEGDKFYFLVSGVVDVTLGNGVEMACSDSCFLGEIGFLTNQPSTASIDATPSADLLEWDVRKLKSLLRRSPTLHESLSRHLARILRNRLLDREETSLPTFENTEQVAELV